MIDIAERIRAYTIANCGNRLRLCGPYLYEHLGLLRKAADRRCHKQVGMSAVAYMWRIQAELARDLLLGTNLKMYSVAEGVGYAGETTSQTVSLCRMYPRHFGISPGGQPRFINIPSYMRKT